MPGWAKHYEISDHGNVRSLTRSFPTKRTACRTLQGRPKALLNCNGYKVLNAKRNGIQKMFLVHRLVYSIYVGAIPRDREIDHRDRNRSNNYWRNLRLATVSQNLSHSVKLKRPTTISGFRGVAWVKPTRRWRADIQFKGKRVFFPLRVRLSDAIEDRVRAEKKIFGRFAPVRK